jgi:hypothetical protein
MMTLREMGDDDVNKNKEYRSIAAKQLKVN